MATERRGCGYRRKAYGGFSTTDKAQIITQNNIKKLISFIFRMLTPGMAINYYEYVLLQ